MYSNWINKFFQNIFIISSVKSKQWRCWEAFAPSCSSQRTGLVLGQRSLELGQRLNTRRTPARGSLTPHLPAGSEATVMPGYTCPSCPYCPLHTAQFLHFPWYLIVSPPGWPSSSPVPWSSTNIPTMSRFVNSAWRVVSFHIISLKFPPRVENLQNFQERPKVKFPF